MRIVAGSLKGRTINAPEGEGTRPTTDRVREALFSSLYSLRGGFEGAVVLDAFSGSGALGIEALSRGAELAVFYENDAKAVRVLRKNLEGCKLDSKVARIVQRDVLKATPTAPGRPFDLVFLDPPYAYDSAAVLGMVSQMRDAGSIADDAIIVYEHALKSADDVTGSFEAFGIILQSVKKYGKTGIAIGIIGQ